MIYACCYSFHSADFTLLVLGLVRDLTGLFVTISFIHLSFSFCSTLNNTYLVPTIREHLICLEL